MTFVLYIIGAMIVGALAGWLLRKKKLSFISPVTMILVCLLLFVLGIEIGSNKQAINELGTLGLPTVVITLAAMAGSILMGWLLWKIMTRRNNKRD